MIMRVLVTRPRKNSAEFATALQGIGAEAIFLPTIAIQPIADTSILDRALERLSCYDWLVLTSANAVDVVLERLSALQVHTIPSTLQIATVGPKTAAQLIAAGFHPDFVPDEYVAEAVVPGLGDLRGRWVLLPMADIAHDTLPKAIQAEDGIAHVITAYHTIPEIPDLEIDSVLTSGLDVITFTSGSSARNFLSLLNGTGFDPFNLPGRPLIACIGPKTARIAQDAGFRVDIIAETYTIEGLVDAIATKIYENCSHATN
jgi:uroporphyrinogen-III synthase